MLRFIELDISGHHGSHQSLVVEKERPFCAPAEVGSLVAAAVPAPAGDVPTRASHTLLEGIKFAPNDEVRPDLAS